MSPSPFSAVITKAIAADDCGASDSVRQAAWLGGDCAVKLSPPNYQNLCAEDSLAPTEAKGARLFKTK